MTVVAVVIKLVTTERMNFGTISVRRNFFGKYSALLLTSHEKTDICQKFGSKMASDVIALRTARHFPSENGSIFYFLDQFCLIFSAENFQTVYRMKRIRSNQ